MEIPPEFLRILYVSITVRLFSFLHKDILKIDNLWSLVNLTKLQMDNNIIERMEGLDMLVNLEWLGS